MKLIEIKTGKNLYLIVRVMVIEFKRLLAQKYATFNCKFILNGLFFKRHLNCYKIVNICVGF